MRLLLVSMDVMKTTKVNQLAPPKKNGGFCYSHHHSGDFSDFFNVWFRSLVAKNPLFWDKKKNLQISTF